MSVFNVHRRTYNFQMCNEMQKIEISSVVSFWMCCELPGCLCVCRIRLLCGVSNHFDLNNLFIYANIIIPKPHHRNYH